MGRAAPRGLREAEWARRVGLTRSSVRLQRQTVGLETAEAPRAARVAAAEPARRPPGGVRFPVLSMRNETAAGAGARAGRGESRG